MTTTHYATAAVRLSVPSIGSMLLKPRRKAAVAAAPGAFSTLYRVDAIEAQRVPIHRRGRRRPFSTLYRVDAIEAPRPTRET